MDSNPSGVMSYEGGEEALARKRTGLEDEKERDSKQKNRGNYRCSRCGEPKKGHVCQLKPRYRRKGTPKDGVTCCKDVQAEIDPEMTVRNLNLAKQGLRESYITIDDTPSNLLSDTILS
mmetsp:Transcript_12590/g.19020  ORF Transcript_12590/g.19020 Transcript_12590/m.19020 type:complete len:119 (-) Transcript_12590:33-389(-)